MFGKFLVRWNRTSNFHYAATRCVQRCCFPPVLGFMTLRDELGPGEPWQRRRRWRQWRRARWIHASRVASDRCHACWCGASRFVLGGFWPTTYCVVAMADEGAGGGVVQRCRTRSGLRASVDGGLLQLSRDHLSLPYLVLPSFCVVESAGGASPKPLQALPTSLAPLP